MLLLLLSLSLLAEGARAACDACVDGYCHERRTILAGFSITDQLAFDDDNYILYLQLNENLNTAVFLNKTGPVTHYRYSTLPRYKEPFDVVRGIQLVDIKKTKGMAVNKKGFELYTGSQEAGTTFFKYDPRSNTTEAVPTIGEDISPHLMYSCSTYFLGLVLAESFENDTTAFHFFQNDTSSPITTLVNYTVSDFAIADERLFFVSKGTLYAYELPSRPIKDLEQYILRAWREPPSVITKGHIVLYVGSYYSGIYIGDATKKVIYFLDYKQELRVYAAYNKGYVEDFILDSEKRMLIVRDSDGSLSEFVKDPSEITCVVEPPHNTYDIRQSEKYSDIPDDPRETSSSGDSSSLYWNIDSERYEYNRDPENA